MCLTILRRYIWKKIDAYYQRQKCSPWSLLSCGVRLMEIGGCVAIGHQTTAGWQKTHFFVISRAYNLRTFRAEAKVTIRRHELFYRLSSERKMIDLEWHLHAILMLKSVLCVYFTLFYCLAFEQNYAITKRYGPTLVATEMLGRDSSLCLAYTTCADFRRLRSVKGANVRIMSYMQS